MTSTDPRDARLVKIEEKLEYSDRHVAELDGLVRDLFAQIKQLRHDLGKLREDTQTQFGELGRDLEDDVPPHWG